jgi:hypothetical protein
MLTVETIGRIRREHFLGGKTMVYSFTLPSQGTLFEGLDNTLADPHTFTREVPDLCSAEISPEHMALRQELINGAVNCRRGNSECATTRTEDRHSGDLSLHVEEGTALASWVKCKVKPNQAVDRASATTVPSPAGKGDDAERGERSSFVISDCHGDLARTQRSIGGRCDRQSVRLEPKHSDVGRWIPTRERGFGLASTRERDFDVLIPLQCFFSGDDDTGTPKDSACGPSGAALNRNHAAGDAFDELCAVVRKCDDRGWWARPWQGLLVAWPRTWTWYWPDG